MLNVENGLILFCEFYVTFFLKIIHTDETNMTKFNQF